MATINSINNKSNPLSSTAVTVNSAVATNSAVQFSISSTPKFIIGTYATDDSFRISVGSVLGTSDTFVMTSLGELTMPLNPAFLAAINLESNVTGNGTNAYIGAVAAATEIFDQGSDFTVGNGAGTAATFTAPITGRYILSFTLTVDIVAAGGNDISAAIVTSNRTFYTIGLPSKNQAANFYGYNNYISQSSAVIADMDSSDTATFWFASNGGAKTANIIEGYIGGCLIA